MKFKKIVVATDLSDTSLTAVETAFNLGMESGATIYLLHVVEPPRMQGDPMLIGSSLGAAYEVKPDALESLVPRNLDPNVKVEKVILRGSPARVIAEFALQEGADLIVVGTHGRKGLARVLLGSTAESLLRQAPCQVLVVKQKVAAPAESKLEAETELTS